MALVVTSPFSGIQVGDVPTMNGAEIEEAIESAYTLYRNRARWLPLHRRVEILDNAARIMLDRRDKLALQAASEGGKPLGDSIVEADRAIDGVRLCIETIRSEAGRVIPVRGTQYGANRLAFTQKEPIGVVVAVSAFNHPLNLIVHQVGAAVAAGCPVLVKPADDTPLSGRAFVDILHEAGLPPEWCRFVMPQDLQLAEQMVTDRRVGFFTFIGSARVGWTLRSKLAAGTRCALEHGGAAPVIVSDDADLEPALNLIAKRRLLSRRPSLCLGAARVRGQAYRPGIRRATGRDGTEAAHRGSDAQGHRGWPADPAARGRAGRRLGR